MILDRLYKSNPKDLASGAAQSIRRYIETITLSGALASISGVGSKCPIDLVRMVRCVCFTWHTNTAAQVPTSTLLQLIDQASNQLSFVGANLQSIQQYNITNDWYMTVPCEILMMQDEQWSATAEFQAGVGVNTAQISIHGFEFARGSIQR